MKDYAYIPKKEVRLKIKSVLYFIVVAFCVFVVAGVSFLAATGPIASSTFWLGTVCIVVGLVLCIFGRERELNKTS